MKVLIVDDHDIVRSGISNILTSNFDVQLSEAKTGSAALDELKKQVFDIVIIDLSLPDMSGLDILSHLVDSDNDCKKIILSSYSNKNYITKCTELGCNSYILKTNVTRELPIALAEVLAGKNYYCEAVKEKVLEIFISGDSKEEVLNDRERTILTLIIEDKSNKEIAEKLKLSIKTIERDRAKILKKLNVNSTIELLKKVLKNPLQFGIVVS